MNVFNLLLKGIYSPKDIAKARFTGIGKAILFIFILSIIAAVPQGYHMSQEISNAMSGFQHVIKKDLPDFSIEKGKLQADQSAPIEKEENGITIIFDPAEKIKASELESKQTAIALLKEKAVIAIDGQMTDIPYQLLGGTLTKMNSHGSQIRTKRLSSLSSVYYYIYQLRLSCLSAQHSLRCLVHLLNECSKKSCLSKCFGSSPLIHSL